MTSAAAVIINRTVRRRRKAHVRAIRRWRKALAFAFGREAVL